MGCPSGQPIFFDVSLLHNNENFFGKMVVIEKIIFNWKLKTFLL